MPASGHNSSSGTTEVFQILKGEQTPVKLVFESVLRRGPKRLQSRTSGAPSVSAQGRAFRAVIQSQMATIGHRQAAVRDLNQSESQDQCDSSIQDALSSRFSLPLTR
jgi:hypothetical protein